jgi:hypothetical protein
MCQWKITTADEISGNRSACSGSCFGRFATWGSDRLNRLRLLAGKGGPGFRDGIHALAEFRLRNISQHGDERRVSNPAEERFRFLRKFQPVMPVANDVLHMLELVDDTLSFRVLVSQFSDITSPLSDDPVLVKRFFRERDMISPELGEFTQRQGKWFSILRDINLAGGALQAFS